MRRITTEHLIQRDFSQRVRNRKRMVAPPAWQAAAKRLTERNDLIVFLVNGRLRERTNGRRWANGAMVPILPPRKGLRYAILVGVRGDPLGEVSTLIHECAHVLDRYADEEIVKRATAVQMRKVRSKWFTQLATTPRFPPWVVRDNPGAWEGYKASLLLDVVGT